MKKLIVLGVWYGIFCFVTGETNPVMWGTFAKVLCVIIAFSIINNGLRIN
jgi:hypothetical protein